MGSGMRGLRLGSGTVPGIDELRLGSEERACAGGGGRWASGLGVGSGTEPGIRDGRLPLGSGTAWGRGWQLGLGAEARLGSRCRA